MTYCDPYPTSPSTPIRVEVEVILVGSDLYRLRIREHETAPIRWIPRKGVKVIREDEDSPRVLLRMTERRAIDLNLV